MRPPSSSSRLLIGLVLAAIAAVFLIGRLWLQRGERAPATEAGIGAGSAGAVAPAK
jgi:multidrug resistance efflux pump